MSTEQCVSIKPTVYPAPTKSRRHWLNRFLGLSLVAVLLFFVNPAYPQVVPYITDIIGEDGVEHSVVRGVTSNGDLRLLGTFKLFNPDAVPFYIWVSFENGGRFKHYKQADLPTVRLVDLELRYKNDRRQPMVKKFPDNRSVVRVKKRVGGSWFGGGRSGKMGSRGGSDDEDVGSGDAVSGRGRSGAVEIVFWKEDAQAYYEMELWGVLYAPDVKGAVVAGSYVENIKFEVEPAR